MSEPAPDTSPTGPLTPGETIDDRRSWWASLWKQVEEDHKVVQGSERKRGRE